MKNILIILTLVSISFSKIEIHSGLGNIHSQNIVSIAAVYGFETGILFDRINFNVSSGFLPYMPTIGFGFLTEWDIGNENNSLIAGYCWEINQAFATEKLEIAYSIPIAYKINFNYVDDFKTSLILGFKGLRNVTGRDNEGTLRTKHVPTGFISIVADLNF